MFWISLFCYSKLAFFVWTGLCARTKVICSLGHSENAVYPDAMRSVPKSEECLSHLSSQWDATQDVNSSENIWSGVIYCFFHSCKSVVCARCLHDLENEMYESSLISPGFQNIRNETDRSCCACQAGDGFMPETNKTDWQGYVNLLKKLLWVRSDDENIVADTGAWHSIHLTYVIDSTGTQIKMPSPSQPFINYRTF